MNELDPNMKFFALRQKRKSPTGELCAPIETHN